MSQQRVVEVSGSSWTPAQIVALVLGVIFVVLGGVALLRTGIDGTLFEPTTSVAGLAYTPLLGLVEVVYGLILLAVGAYPRASEGVVFLGVVAFAFGLLLVIEPAAFQTSLAAGRTHGWFYVVTGAIAAGAGLATPAILRRRVERQHEAAHRHEARRQQADAAQDHAATQQLGG